MTDGRLLRELIDEHSLQTVYDRLADRSQGLEVLAVGDWWRRRSGDARSARPARMYHERDRMIVADPSYRYGQLSNLYFSTGGPCEALREAVNFDVVVAIEPTAPRELDRRLGSQARDGQ